MLFDYFTQNLTILFMILSFFGLIAIALQFQLYFKFKSRLNTTEIEIQKDRKEI